MYRHPRWWRASPPEGRQKLPAGTSCWRLRGYNPACGQEGVCPPSVDTHAVRRGLKNQEGWQNITSHVDVSEDNTVGKSVNGHSVGQGTLKLNTFPNRRNRWKVLSLHNLLPNTTWFTSVRGFDTNFMCPAASGGKRRVLLAGGRVWFQRWNNPQP